MDSVVATDSSGGPGGKETTGAEGMGAATDAGGGITGATGAGAAMVGIMAEVMLEVVLALMLTLPVLGPIMGGICIVIAVEISWHEEVEVILARESDQIRTVSFFNSRPFNPKSAMTIVEKTVEGKRPGLAGGA
jgi:hypothetical protein